jgi:Flp pilus assembly protein TadG
MQRPRLAQSLVEFALVFPIVLTMMLSVIEGGRLIFTWIILAEASREAARTATLHNTTSTATVANRAMDLGNVVGATTSEVSVQLNGVTQSGTFSRTKQRGDIILVQIDHTFTPTGVSFADVPITVSTQMPVES